MLNSHFPGPGTTCVGTAFLREVRCAYWRLARPAPSPPALPIPSPPAAGHVCHRLGQMGHPCSYLPSPPYCVQALPDLSYPWTGLWAFCSLALACLKGPICSHLV